MILVSIRHKVVIQRGKINYWWKNLETEVKRINTEVIPSKIKHSIDHSI